VREREREGERERGRSEREGGREREGREGRKSRTNRVQYFHHELGKVATRKKDQVNPNNQSVGLEKNKKNLLFGFHLHCKLQCR
jgi:hypothetical protein